MTDNASLHDVYATYQRRNTLQFEKMCFSLILLCTFFNFFLCFINTNVHGISTAVIIGCEIILIFSAAFLGFHRVDKAKLYWLAVLGAQFFLFVFFSLIKHEALAKPLRDVIIMPVFMVLGLSCYRLNLVRPLLAVLFIVLIVGLLEAFWAEKFLSIFNFKDYFVAKGAMEEFAPQPLNTFASGTRPGGRFLLDLPGIHRIASIFLEPISLGFFSFILALYFISIRKEISHIVYGTAVAMALVLIWLSDARMALGCFMATFIFKELFSRIDHRFSLIVFPICLMAAYTVDAAGLLDIGGEGIGARIHSTVLSLDLSSLEVWMGFGKVTYTADSGLADMMKSQGILSVLIFWISPVIFMKRVPPEARVFIWGVAFYLAFGFLISPAYTSIKTAALLWFMYGSLLYHDRYHEELEYNG